MNKLEELLLAKSDVFQVLCGKYTCEISLALYVYSDTEESTPSVHLEKRHTKLLGDLGIQFDLDLYVFQAKY